MEYLKFAWISGIIAFALLVPANILGFILTNWIVIIAYAVLTLSGLVFNVLFLVGFVILGKRMDNKFLFITTLLLLIVAAVLQIYNGVLMFSGPGLMVMLWVVTLILTILFGVIEVLFGVALITTWKTFDGLSISAGIIEIITAAFLFSVFLAWAAAFVSIPAMILEIIIIYKAAQRFGRGSK